MKIPNINIENNSLNTFLYRGTYSQLDKPLKTFNDLDPIAYISNGTNTYIDNKDISETGIEKYGPNPVTISKPNVNYRIYYNELNIPYICFDVTNSNNIAQLHYRCVCCDNNNKYTNLSNIFNIDIQQKLQDISSSLYVNNDGSWSILSSVNLTKTNYINNILNETIKPLNSNDINFNNTYVENTNTCIVEIPNIWFEDNIYQLRKTKEYKIINTINDGNNVESDVFKTDVIIPIDKITIERDDKIISIIRKNGTFYIKDTIHNINESIVSEDTVIDFGLNFNKIFIYDEGVICGRTYNYVITLYDSIGNNISTIKQNTI